MKTRLLVNHRATSWLQKSLLMSLLLCSCSDPAVIPSSNASLGAADYDKKITENVGSGTLSDAVNNSASAIQFETAYWEDVFKNAKKEKKPIFIYGYAAWCNPCAYANRILLTDTTVVKYFNENFLSMKFEMETRYYERVTDAWDILNEYGIQFEAYPLFLFFNSKGEIISKVQGVQGSSTSYFIMALN